MIGALLEIWQFDARRDLAEVMALAGERRVPPAFRGHLLSTRGDALTLQLADGSPGDDARALYYVRGHGAFVLGRIERWPSPRPGGAARVLVTLLAFPRPDAMVMGDAR